MKSDLKRQFIWNTLGSGLYSFNSLFFMIIVTRINGVKTAGVFNFCFATSCIFYAIALYSGRTYQVTETQKSLDDNVFILNRFMTTSAMLIVALAFGLISKFDSYKLLLFIILCVSKAIESLCDVFHGILQKSSRLDIAGKSMLLRCLLSLMLFFAVDYFTENIIYSCISLVIADLFFLLFVDVTVTKKYKESCDRVNAGGALRLIRLGFYTFGFTLIANYLVNAPRYPLNAHMEIEYQTIFGIIAMPASIILLANQVLIQPMIVRMKNSYLENDRKSFLSKTYYLCGTVILIGALCDVLAYFFGAYVLKMLYGLDVSGYITDLMIIISGATVYSLAGVLSNALMVLRKTRVQFFIYLLSAVYAYLIAEFLTVKHGFGGAVFSYFTVMLVLFVMYAASFVYFVRKSFVISGNDESVV